MENYWNKINNENIEIMRDYSRIHFEGNNNKITYKTILKIQKFELIGNSNRIFCENQIDFKEVQINGDNNIFQGNFQVDEIFIQGTNNHINYAEFHNIKNCNIIGLYNFIGKPDNLFANKNIENYKYQPIDTNLYKYKNLPENTYKIQNSPLIFDFENQEIQENPIISEKTDTKLINLSKEEGKFSKENPNKIYKEKRFKSKPISYMRKNLINSFPIFKYTSNEYKISQSECAICFKKFYQNTILKSLNPCSHIFHAKCIDKWLREHSTCPLCRISIIPL